PLPKLHVGWASLVFGAVLLQLDPFLNELTSMFERSTETGSVWSQVVRNKMATAGVAIEYRCLIRTINRKKTISTSGVQKKLPVGALRVTLLVRNLKKKSL
ncbi:hypothetical protein S245_020913, partial [Arachis hypogaea]